ncbi:hypothetical protein Mal35_26470 [Gimesia maris]|uniref:four helix bundle protein n=1 Tax=Gimesia maris TaxID=122 RepID=UPI001187ED3E|nr:four helix bundle protein [Gimesia maris]QDT79192.1 hypothetical protein Mal35_26470 [Gimesia maris]
MVKHYRELIAWQKAMSMVTHVYELTQTLPDNEKFGLVSQIRRSAVSVPSNIAEGQARNTTGEFIQFLGIARGSTAELTTQLLIAANLGYITETDKALPMVEEVGRILSGLIKSLRTKN